jgi:hypothetical protein
MHSPLSGHLTDRRIAALAEPLRNQFLFFIRFPMELCTYRGAQLGQVSLLDFQIAIHPVVSKNLPFRIKKNALAAQIIEKTGNAIAKILGRHAKSMGIFLDPRQCRVESFIVHLHPSPGLKADGLPRGKRHFPKHLNPEKFTALLFVAAAAAFAADNLPDFGNKSAREGFILFQDFVKMHGQIANGHGPAFEAVSHQGAQTEASGVILHPSCLKGRILTVVAEYQQTGPLRVVHHILRQDMNIRNIGGADGSGRFPVCRSDHPSIGSAGQATRKETRIVLFLPDGIKHDRNPCHPAMAATADTRWVCGAAATAKIQCGRSLVVIEIFILTAAHDAIQQYHTLAALAFF